MTKSNNENINEKFYRFIDILRDANINISTDEVLSLFNALPYSSINDRGIFKQTLQSTLIKDYTDIPVFEKCFDEFFLNFTIDKKTLEEEIDHLNKAGEQDQSIKDTGISEKDMEKLMQD